MDYEAFYAEIVVWINDCNQKAVSFGITSSEFWTWVMDSVGEMCDRYQNNELVQRQTIMLVEWLQDIYEKARG